MNAIIMDRIRSLFVRGISFREVTAMWIALLAGALCYLFLIIPDVPERIDVRKRELGPLHAERITGVPGADIKRTLVYPYFEAESNPASQARRALERGDFSAAIFMAYVLNDFATIRAAVNRAASQTDGFTAYNLIDALDRTLLFEAEALHAAGHSRRALQKHAFYLSLIRSIDVESVDPNSKNLARRLTLTRLRQFQLERQLHGETPYLDRLFASFFADFASEFPYREYSLERSEDIPEPNAAQSKIAYFDSCLYQQDAHGKRDERGSGCASTFEAKFGKDLLSLVLRYAGLHYRLVHQPAGPENGPAENLTLVQSFLGDVKSSVPQANFLIDDIVFDLVGSEDEQSDGTMAPRWAIRPGDLRALLCDTRLTHESGRASYDRFEALVEAAEERGVTCA